MFGRHASKLAKYAPLDVVIIFMMPKPPPLQEVRPSTTLNTPGTVWKKSDNDAPRILVTKLKRLLQWA
jgi:hypothetical protein